MVHYPELLLTVAGILVLLYGMFTARKLRQHLGSGSVKEAWDLLSIFIALFILGYIGFLANLTVLEVPISSEQITAVVFFMGSIFVALTAHYNYQAFARS
ncbi:MAG: hypothetical protein SVU32_08470 [Candidatus Nanohaloarchaea archaeon]|nr:hypothetical protein [Candidatus Nanohaloarchaea archaeon]